MPQFRKGVDLLKIRPIKLLPFLCFGYDLVDIDPLQIADHQLQVPPVFDKQPVPVQFLEFWYKTDYDVYDNIFALHDLEGTYRTRRGDFFKLEYYFKDNGELNDTNQINGVIDAALFSSLRARFSIEHSIANEETNEANLALLYQALCWSVELGSQYTPEETKFMLIFSLANLGSPLKFYY